MKRLTKKQKDMFDGFLIGEVLAYLKKWRGFQSSSKIMRGVPLLSRSSDVRRIINIMRTESIPIISSNKGYAYTENKDDVKTYCVHLRSRTMNIINAYNGLLDYLDEDSKKDITKYNFKKDGNE